MPLHFQNRSIQACIKNDFFLCQEFLVHLIDAEKRKAAALSWSTNANDAMTATSKELLANPIMFLRKWVGEVKNTQCFNVCHVFFC